jgi:cytochrome c oxidase assembly protein subunit 15
VPPTGPTGPLGGGGVPGFDRPAALSYHRSVARDTRPVREVTPARFAGFTRSAFAAQVLIVMSGAAVRLTGSGLGCSDWPNCERDRLVAPLEFHPMIEFANRLVSFVVVATIVLVIWGALRRVPYRRDLLDLGWWIAGVTVAQIVLGGVLVNFDLWPPLVMGHFLLSMILIAVAVVLHHRAVADASGPGETGGAGALPWTVRIWLLVAGAAVLLSGAVVTGSGPHGGDDRAERLGFYVPTVTRVHTATVFTFLAVLLVLLLRPQVRRSARLMRAGRVVLGLAVVQGAIGYYQYFNGVPALAVFLHVVGATAVWAGAWWFALELARPAAPRIVEEVITT